VGELGIDTSKPTLSSGSTCARHWTTWTRAGPGGSGARTGVGVCAIAQVTASTRLLPPCGSAILAAAPAEYAGRGGGARGGYASQPATTRASALVLARRRFGGGGGSVLAGGRGTPAGEVAMRFIPGRVQR
jgi:hypothetical protein